MLATTDLRIRQAVLERLLDSFDSSFDSTTWIEDRLGALLFDNQSPIVEAVSDKNDPFIAIIGSRQGGKSYAVCCGAIKMSRDLPGYKWTVWGPKGAQATRLIEEITEILKKSNISDTVDWKKSNTYKLQFKDGGGFLALSAAPESEVEGWPSDGVIIDEAHRVADNSVRLHILPTLGASRLYKVVKLGMPMYKRHFHKSFKDPKYKKIRFTWKEAQIHFKSGSIHINGEEYPKLILDMMPYTIKQKYFPKNPEMWTQGELTEFEWYTQYDATWQEGVDLFLSELAVNKLIGTHEWLEEGIPGEVYYGALDFAGGSLMKGNKLDFTHLSIIRETEDKVREKVAAFEWQGDLYKQMKEIIPIIHPTMGRFKCKKVLADYGHGAAIVDILMGKKFPITGIMYGWKEEKTRKNYKNAIYDHTWRKIVGDSFKYPKNYKKHPIMKKARDEWQQLEKHERPSGNADIKAPEGFWDDATDADAMANFVVTMKIRPMRDQGSYFPLVTKVAHTNERFQKKSQRLRGIPEPLIDELGPMD